MRPRFLFPYQPESKNVTNLAIAIAAKNACTNKVLHLNYNGRSRRCAQGHDRPYSSVAVAKCLATALRRAKGWDGGKTNCRATTKSFFEIESD